MKTSFGSLYSFVPNCYLLNVSSSFFQGIAKISCKNLWTAGYTSSGTYNLKVSGYSFQVSAFAFFSKRVGQSVVDVAPLLIQEHAATTNELSFRHNFQ